MTPRERKVRLPQRAKNPTPAERRLLQMLAAGMNRAEIAAATGAKPRTLTNQLHRLRSRFGTTTEALMVAATVLRWITPPLEITEEA